MAKVIKEVGILREIKTPKPELFFCVMELDNKTLMEPGGFIKQAPAPDKNLIGKRCEFKYTIRDKYTNLYPKFQGKKIIGWQIYEIKNEPIYEIKDEPIEEFMDSDTSSPPTKVNELSSEILREVAMVHGEIAEMQILLNRAVQIVEKSSKRDNTYWDKRDKSIVRQACIKAACRITASAIEAKLFEFKDVSEAGKGTIELAEKFAKYCNMEE